MATKLQFQTIRSIVSKVHEDLGLLPSRAFLFFVLDKYFKNLNESEIDEAIIDGSGDCGIDAIFIDEKDSKRSNIYIFQSKYYESKNGFERNFEGTKVEKMKIAINELLLSNKGYEKYGNALLQDKIRTINNILDPKYIIIFCSNSDNPTKPVQKKFNKYISDLNRESGKVYFDIVYLHLDKIAKLLVKEEEIKINEMMKFCGKYFSTDTGDARLFAGITSAEQLIRLVDKYDERMFDKNVRGFLKRSNLINQKIIQTSSSSEFSPYFVYMNNGVTITCDKFTFKGGSDSPNVRIEGLQVVNGQQTIRSLSESCQNKSLKDNVQVIVRLVETSDKDLLREIIEATNSQTKVSSRDLHSNDPIQKMIERYLKSKGYFYEARKNKFQGRKARKYRVDAERATQAYYAAKFERPAIAKDKKKILFGEEYETIFNEESLDMAEFLICYLLIENVKEWNKEEKLIKKYSFLKDASLHSVALLFRLGINSFDDFSDGILKPKHKKRYVKILKAISEVVAKRVRKEGDKYEHRKTFKDPETYGRVVELLKE